MIFKNGQPKTLAGIKKVCFSVVSAGVLMSSSVVNASYLSASDLQSSSYTVFDTPTAWNPGADTARVGNFPAAGGATWSIMGAGLSDVSGYDPHGAAVTSDITTLGFSLATIENIIDTAMNQWAAVSGFVNLGQVADGNVGFGASNLNGGNQGDIRIGAINIDGPASVLAHAYQPGTEAIFGAGGSITGDMHIDNSENWVSGFDLGAVVLHELGHSLGLDHSTDTNAIMYPYYSGQLTLGLDDIAGIQSIYGPATVVPVPAAVWLFMSGFGLLGLYGRRRA